MLKVWIVGSEGQIGEAINEVQVRKKWCWWIVV